MSDHGIVHTPRRKGSAFALAAVMVLLCTSGCSRDPAVLPSGTLTIRTTFGPARLHVEIADTDQARAVGLMGRRTLGPDAGMAFLWDGSAQRSFWMKDTLIPLSIAFWDRSHVQAILDMEPCTANPCPAYRPGKAFGGAVEANLGYFVQHHVTVGDPVELSR